jgi:DNA-binding CsgD family transcriptional regulator
MAMIRDPGFVGRERELATLSSALAVPPAVVLVEGETGIGKSRLITEFVESAAHLPGRVLVARCPPFARPQTLGPVTGALRQAVPAVRELRLSALAGALRPMFPEWAVDLPPALEPAEDASAARHRLFAALAELLDCLQAGLLVVEDAHWADEATVEFLLFLAAREVARPVSLVVTCRPEDVPPGSVLHRLSRLAAGAGGRRLVLGPLDLAGTAALVASMLPGASVSEAFTGFLHERTEGVPLAVEESVRLLAERGDVFWHPGGGWARRHLADISVPHSIRGAVLERAGRLGPAATAVLRAAAVLAEPAGEALIAAVAGLPGGEAGGGLSAGLECGLLAGEAAGLVRFRHALAGQAVYDAIPGPQLRVLHLRAGTALEGVSPPPLARLARHFREAGDRARWRDYGKRAAMVALAAGDEAAAAVLLHALVTSGDVPARDVARLAGRLPLGALAEDRFGDLIAVLRATLAAGALGRAGEADVRVQLGQALTHIQDWEAGRAELERAIPHLGHDPLARARAMMLLAWPRGTACPAAGHLRWLRRAAEADVPRGQADELRAAVDRASALLMLGRQAGWAEAARIPADAPTAAARREITRGHLNIGDQALRWGRYAEAGRRLAIAAELAGRCHYGRLHDDAVAVRLHLDWCTGNWAGLAGRAAGLADDPGVHLMSRMEAALVAGLAEAAAGERRRARQRLDWVLAHTGPRGQLEYLMEPAAAAAWLWLADGRVSEALEVTAGPAGIVAAKGIWVWAADLAPARVAALAAAGRASEAAELAAAFTGGLRGRGAPAAWAAAAACRAIVAEAAGQYAAAAALAGRAAAAWQALPRPYEALLARERQARCLLAAGQGPAALGLLREVCTGLAGLGARGDAVRVMGTLREHGIEVRRPWHGGRTGYGDRLSPRELETARLLTGGRTNRQIAQELSLSPRTVARHLDAARRKLKVRSRTALAARLVELGLADAGQPAPGPPAGQVQSG